MPKLTYLNFEHPILYALNEFNESTEEIVHTLVESELYDVNEFEHNFNCAIFICIEYIFNNCEMYKVGNRLLEYIGQHGSNFNLKNALGCDVSHYLRNHNDEQRNERLEIFKKYGYTNTPAEKLTKSPFNVPTIDPPSQISFNGQSVGGVFKSGSSLKHKIHTTYQYKHKLDKGEYKPEGSLLTFKEVAEAQQKIKDNKSNVVFKMFVNETKCAYAELSGQEFPVPLYEKIGIEFKQWVFLGKYSSIKIIMCPLNWQLEDVEKFYDYYATVNKAYDMKKVQDNLEEKLLNQVKYQSEPWQSWKDKVSGDNGEYMCAWLKPLLTLDI